MRGTLAEIGPLVHLDAHLLNLARSTTVTRFFVGRCAGGCSAAMRWESEASGLAPPARHSDLLNCPHDPALVAAILAHIEIGSSRSTEQDRHLDCFMTSTPPPPDYVDLFWSFTPPEYFEAPVEVVRDSYVMKIERGSVSVRMSAAEFDSRPKFEDELSETLKTRFLAAAMFNHQPYKLENAVIKRVDEQGYVHHVLIAEAVTMTMERSTSS
jgi:hypothetical protein